MCTLTHKQWHSYPSELPFIIERSFYIVGRLAVASFSIFVRERGKERVIIFGIWAITKETEDRRELTQHGILPCLAGGGWRGNDLYDDGRALPPLPCLRAAQLRTSGHPSCYSCWFITKCTQNTDITEISKEGRGRISMYSMTALYLSLPGREGMPMVWYTVLWHRL